MSGTTFSISSNETEYCYDPIVCATNNGHMVTWAYGVDIDQSTLWAQVFNGRKAAKPVKLMSLNDQETVLFLRRFDQHTFALAVETLKGTTIYLLDEYANITDTQMYNSTDMLVYCYPTDEGVVLFTYNHEKNTLVVGRVDPRDWNKGYTVMHTYNGVCSIPYVFIQDLYYIAGWITSNNALYVANGTVSIGGDGQSTTLDKYNVNYLIATVSDNNTVVYGGYSSNDKTLRLDFFNISEGKYITSKYWKSNEYSSLQFSMASLNRGFMLLADGAECEHVCGQRFTHIGSWLYPTMQLEDGNEPTWSPSLARSSQETLLVYISDYDDHSQVWGKWLPVSDIQEIENLSL